MSAYDSQPRRGRTAVAVLLAVALLAVVGAVFGYLLGVKHNNATAQAGPTTGPGATTPAGKQCPDFIGAAAHAEGAPLPLTQRLHVLTKQHSGDTKYHAEVWICADAGGTLWYQGHTITASLAEPVYEGKNGILVRDANSIDSGKYVATYVDGSGRSTRYTVGPNSLDIVSPDGTSSEPVAKSDS